MTPNPPRRCQRAWRVWACDRARVQSGNTKRRGNEKFHGVSSRRSEAVLGPEKESVLVAGLACWTVAVGRTLAALVAATRFAVATSSWRSAVGLDLDQTTRDAGVLELVEHGRAEVRGQLDDREVRVDLDPAEV